MARAATLQEAPPEVDTIEGLPLPRERSRLVGHAAAETALLEAYRSSRIHHGWLIGGARGIGKATLAYRFARFVLTHPDPSAPAVRDARDLSVDPQARVARWIAAGAHPDLLPLRRPWNDKEKRFKTELPVDEVRRTVGFFGSTAAEGGWRVAIVDPADEMNAAAANALLKILEEPPSRSLILVLSHQPGRLLPTIRSRCRRLDLAPLADEEVLAALQGLGFAERTDASTLAAAARLSEGSVRRAVVLVENDGVGLHRRIETLTGRLPAVDWRAVHALADEVTAKGADEAFEMAIDFVLAHAVARARTAAEAGATARAAAWAEAHAAIGREVATVDALNLDKRSLVLSILRTLVEAARN